MIVVTGATGQLGFELHRLLGDSARFLNSQQLDLRQPERFEAVFRELKPSLLINAAAYTQVDNAETESDQARLINTVAPTRMAELAERLGFRFVHLSTDYVFDGRASAPYLETAPVHPLNVYGRTKAESETQVLEACPQALILRTSWVYSSHGHNFVKTILRLSKDRPSLNVVFDQVGGPTYARDLAETILQARELSGLYHFSNEGVASWYDFACAIRRLRKLPLAIEPICSLDYPQKAKRPSFSVMNKGKIKSALNLKIPHWMESLEKCLSEIS